MSYFKSVESATIVTFEDPLLDEHARRRTVKVNGIQVSGRGREATKDANISTLDPSFSPLKSWSYLIPRSALEHGFPAEEIPTLQRAVRLRSVGQAVCLIELAWLGDREGLEEVLASEDCDDIRNITEASIAPALHNPSDTCWLLYLSNPYFPAYAQMFDSIEMRPSAQALAKMTNLVIIDRRRRANNKAQTLLVGGTNILGCAVMKELRLTSVARRRFYCEESNIIK